MAEINNGISCCNGGWVGTRCQNSIEQTQTETREEFEDRAGIEGWCTGHLDGQGHYVCPDCRGTLWDEVPFVAVRKAKTNER